MHSDLIKIIALITIAGPFAVAEDFSFTGSLAADDSVQLFSFTLASTNTITLQTHSYAGGLDQAGAAVSRGGFDPILALFDTTGLLINEDDDGYANVFADAVTGQRWDSYIHTTLAAGTYTIALTQYDNFPNGPDLNDGFSRTGQPQFTSAFGCSSSGFCDRTGNNRTANWEFDVLDTASATAIPEPRMSTLMITGVALIGAWRGRKSGWNFLIHNRKEKFNSSLRK